MPAKSKKSLHSLRLETLESRQLLAGIVGDGVEVLSNFPHPNGNIYDQILMTGPSVTVTPDPGQYVRVSFLDQNGDIVQTQLSGAGTMTITLENLKRAGDTGYINTNPDQNLPHGGYVQGLASVTIDKPALSTELNIFPVGLLMNPGLFSGEIKKGGDGFADIARITLVGNASNPAGFANMGSIIAGGVVFSANEGVVGIRGEYVAVQGRVIIGDIDSHGTGQPWLHFNTNSQFQNVIVRGGDLKQTNDAAFETGTFGGLSSFTMTAGSTSDDVEIPAQQLDPRVMRNISGLAGFASGDPRVAFDLEDPHASTASRPLPEVVPAFGSSSSLEDDTVPSVENVRVVVV